MKRNLSGWGVTLSGVMLAVCGAYAMNSGWDRIQLERGWALFISGAVALSGGVVTIALGRVVAHLSRIGAATPTPAVAGPEILETADVAAPVQTPAAIAVKDAEPVKAASASTLRAEPARPASVVKAVEPTKPQEPQKAADDPEPAVTEVDRYTAGDATYVMYSDGSVEVRTPHGSARYESLAALRAEAEARRH